MIILFDFTALTLFWIICSILPLNPCKNLYFGLLISSIKGFCVALVGFQTSPCSQNNSLELNGANVFSNFCILLQFLLKEFKLTEIGHIWIQDQTGSIIPMQMTL